ncbi:ribonuclease H-like domain-containing protein, partial [Syncephalis plumigaleata]
YAVRNGRQKGVYNTWDECKAQVNGYPNAVFKRFDSANEAQRFMEGLSQTATRTTAATVANPSAGNLPTRNDRTIIAAKIRAKPYQRPTQKRMATTASLNSLNPLLRTNEKVSLDTIDDKKQDHLVIYTDGSGLSNGQQNAIAGVGVYFGANDSRNISEPLAGAVQTNQRAEITAVIRALETAGVHQPVEIRTDSAYVVNAVNSWIRNWKQRNWRKSDGKPVMNDDLFRRLDELLMAHTSPVKMTHVRAHIGIEGNEAADRLAVNGA